MGLLGQDLHGGVLVDGDGPGGNEELLGGAVILEDGDHARFEHGQRRDVLREDTERPGEGGDVHLSGYKRNQHTRQSQSHQSWSSVSLSLSLSLSHLLDAGGVVEDTVRGGEGEAHLGHIPPGGGLDGGCHPPG